ncbi:MAG: Cof-type HAD-IIB family hydrolase [Coprobacillaceae bacterium]
MKEKLLFFDIDGTLIECKLGIFDIPDTTTKSLQALQKLGHRTFLATDRAKCFIVDGVMKYPFDGYVTCNGAHVEYEGKTIYKEVISKEALQVTHEYCIKHNMVYYFEGNKKIYTPSKNNPTHIDFAERWIMKDKVVEDNYDISSIEAHIGMIVVNSKEQIEDMKKTLSPYFDVQRHHSEYSFDLTLKGVSKAVGIEKLTEAIHKDIKDTIAFGDGYNDLEMLETVGLGIAMGNGADEAKDASNYVTSRIEEDGITKALEHFSLI